MRVEHDERMGGPVSRLRETMAQLWTAFPERNSPVARGLGSLVDWLHAGLVALSDAADTADRDPTLRSDPVRAVKWLVSVAGTLLWMEDTALAAGVEWPAGVLSVRPELRASVREALSS